MTSYRFYRLGRANHIFSREQIEFATDRDAVAHAMVMSDESAVEVWDRDRKIAYIAKALWPIGGRVKLNPERCQPL